MAEAARPVGRSCPGDVIVALATPRGAAARAVIRVSGERALAVVGALAGSRGVASAARGVHPVALVLGRRGFRIEASLWVFRAPRSFTGEDLVEIHLPGAPVLVDRTIAALLAAGARSAEPGEFSKRAFLAGKLDLTRAEAIAALVSAQDEGERRAALATLEGGLERRVAALRDRLRHVLVPIELGLDFSDQDVEIPVPADAGDVLDEVAAEAAGLAGLALGGDAVARSSFRVVLHGAPNAGKSSLFNALLGRAAAIVAEVPGTTRDALLGTIAIEGLSVLLVDTAGVLEHGTVADEAAARERERRLREADLVLEVVDPTREPVAVPSASASRLLVLSRADLLPAGTAPTHGIAVSSVTGAGLDTLRAAIRSRLAGASDAGADAPLAISGRHAAGFLEVRRATLGAKAALRAAAPPECVAAELHAALRALLSITGEIATEAVLSGVFAGFCIGK